MNRYFGTFHALNLTAERGERIVVCGPSGAGKSTLIRCINLWRSTSRERSALDADHIDEIRRETGMVVQNFNCFPT